MTKIQITNDEATIIKQSGSAWVQRPMNQQPKYHGASMVGEQTHGDHVTEVDASFDIYEVGGESYGSDCGHPPLINLCPYEVGTIIGQHNNNFVIVDREHSEEGGLFHWSVMIEPLSEANQNLLRHGEERHGSRRHESFLSDTPKSGRFGTVSHSGTVTENWCRNCQDWQTAAGLAGAFSCPQCGICWLNAEDWEEYKVDWDTQQQKKEMSTDG